jgi:hypothetical protein
MCFSATASFGASLLLATIGTISIVKAKTSSFKVLAIIPFIFSIQQLAEGFVWLSLTKEGYAFWKVPCMYTFLFFAQIAWPICISLSIMLLEKNENRKKIFRFLFYGGVLLSSVLAYTLYYYSTDVKVIGNHLMYSVDTPETFKTFTNLIYFSTALLPPFLSTIKKVWVIGIILIVSFVIAKIFYVDYIISIWCYFATLISVIILWVIAENKQKDKLKISQKFY